MVSIDAILHRPDARHGTFGPTGTRLFTERIEEGLGIRGQFCYIHHGGDVSGHPDTFDRTGGLQLDCSRLSRLRPGKDVDARFYLAPDH